MSNQSVRARTHTHTHTHTTWDLNQKKTWVQTPQLPTTVSTEQVTFQRLDVLGFSLLLYKISDLD